MVDFKIPDVLIVSRIASMITGLQLLMRARAIARTFKPLLPAPSRIRLEAETRRFGGMFLIKPVDPRHVIEAVRAVDSPEAMPHACDAAVCLLEHAAGGPSRRIDGELLSRSPESPRSPGAARQFGARRNGDRRPAGNSGVFPRATQRRSAVHRARLSRIDGPLQNRTRNS